MNRIAIIAGSGDLPEKVFSSIRTRGGDIVFVCLKGQAKSKLETLAPSIWVTLGEVSKALNFIRRHRIDEVVMIGAVKRPSLHSLRVDAQGKKLLGKIAKGKIFGDNTLLTIVKTFFEDEGFTVRGVDELIGGLIIKKGQLTDIKLSNQDKVDIELGQNVLSSLSKYDIGQSIIIENGLVLGIEAVEGTDELIKRCSKLKKDDRSGILVKFAKIGQERKIDLPTIGLDTLYNLSEAGFRGVVFKADSTIIIDKESVIEFASAKHLILQGV